MKTTIKTIAAIAAMNMSGFTISASDLQPINEGYAVAISETQNSFGTVGLANVFFLREYSEELYEKAIHSRIECLRLRELEDKKRAEIEEKRRMEEEEEKRIEKERKAAETAARKAEKEKFFQVNKDILIENMTSFQKLAAYSELNKLYRFDGEIKSFLTMIRTEGFTKKSCYTRYYSTQKKNLYNEKLKKPIRECFLGNGQCSYNIPAKLYDVLRLEEIR